MANLLKQLFHAAIHNAIARSLYQTQNKTARGSGTRHHRDRVEFPAGSKIAKACKKHRADHSNPGGIISEYFRQKHAKV